MTERIYRVLDARPEYGYFMLESSATEPLIRLWRRTPGTALETQLRTLTQRHGYELSVEVTPPTRSWPEDVQARLSKAANQMRRLLGGAPEAGFAALKLEAPLGTLVLWRTTPNPQVDQELEAIARSRDVKLELRRAPMSKAEGEQLTETLRNNNDAWQDLGFTVNGAYVTGSGPVVVIRGDLAAATDALATRDDIVAVVEDDTETL